MTFCFLRVQFKAYFSAVSKHYFILRAMLINPEQILTSAHDIPSFLLAWVAHDGSLTKKLKHEFGDASVQVLKQSWVAAGWWEKHVLNIDDEMVRHREILMWSKNEPCWYARTIIPYSSYHTKELFFDRLNTESLDKLIFDNNRINRFMLMNYSITSHCLEYYWVEKLIFGDTKVRWVRLSGFTLDINSPFYLIEIMLPGIEKQK